MAAVDLQAEIERLTRELDQASSENIQSAKYGLVLLEEKQNLQLKCEELETCYENARHELDITQEVGIIGIFFLCQNNHTYHTIMQCLFIYEYIIKQ